MEVIFFGRKLLVIVGAMVKGCRTRALEVEGPSEVGRLRVG